MSIPSETYLINLLSHSLTSSPLHLSTLYLLESHCTKIFLERRHHLITVSPVIFEALCSLASSNPPYRARILTGIIVLAACSSQAWTTIACSSLFHVFPESTYILMNLMAGEKACVEVDSHVLEQIAHQLTMKGGDESPDFNGAVVAKLPIKVIVEQVVASINANEENCEQKVELLRKVISRLPSERLDSVTDEEWHVIAPFLTRNGETYQGMSERMAVMSRVGPDGELGEAFERVKRMCAGRNDKDVHKLFAGWIRDGRVHMACAAYLAAPNVLGSVVMKRGELCEGVGALGLHVWSEIDGVIDAELRRLLCGVRELARVLGGRWEDGSREALLGLKRVALVHPFIMARRIPCLESVCRTVLHGLSEKDAKYRKGALRVLEVVVEVVRLLPRNCLREENVGNLCAEILRFLVEESRGENGVPEMFADLTIAVFKLVNKAEGVRKGEVADMVEKIRRGRGTAKQITNAADNLFG